jgi:tripartite-type tricarboxylate transporter receptor subunit TctC
MEIDSKTGQTGHIRVPARGLALVAGAALAAAGAAQAQTQPSAAEIAAYPNRPIHIIVPFVAGGPTDIQARWAGQQLTTALGQPVIVENKAAAGGVPATAAVLKGPADGYTLLAANPGPITIAPSVRANIGYTLKDVAPILLIAKTPSCIAVRTALPAKDFRQFVALAKSQPGVINYGSPGIGTVGQLTVELISTQAGIKLNHIPYRGAAQYVADLVGGQLDLATVQLAACVPLQKQGKLTALAVTSLKRSPLLPDVPTLAESGLAGFDTNNWNGLLAPAGTPPAILKKIRDVVAEQMATPAAQDWFHEQGYESGTESLEAYGGFLDVETQRWARIAKAANIKAE